MNQTIYFRKDIWESFKDEPDKSKVINALLEEHYTPYIEVGRALKESPVPTKDRYVLENTGEIRGPISLDEVDDDEPDFSDYVYDPATKLIYDRDTGEQVAGKVDKNGRIVDIL